MTWHIQMNGQAKGPFTDDQLKAFCETGAASGASMVWRAGFPDWKPLRQTDFVIPAVQQTTYSGASAMPLPGTPPAAGSVQVVVDDMSPWNFFWRAISSRYGDFHTRARRKEFWSFYMFYTLITFGIVLVGLLVDALVGNFAAGRANAPIATLILIGIWSLAMFVPTLAMWIRRLHDSGIPGPFALILFIPYVNIFGIFLMPTISLLPSEPKRNRWGPSPK